MNTIASLSLIRPLLVSLWDGPLSEGPRPPLEGPRRGLGADLRGPFVPSSPSPSTLLHLTAIIPLVTRLPLSGDAKKRAW